MDNVTEKKVSLTKDPTIITPKVDYAFKQMMNNQLALKSFLSAILKIKEENITDISYIDTHTLKEYDNDKYIVMDIRILVDNSYEINIEMQMMNFRYWTDRALYYTCKMLAGQMRKSDDYSIFKKCISISVLDFNIFDSIKYKNYYSSYHISEDTDRRMLNDLLEFHIIELPKIPEDSVDELENGELLKWVKFLNSESKEEMEMLAKQNTGIKEAYKELESLENDDERRAVYEAREKAIMDYRVQQRAAKMEGKEEGREEGREEGKLEAKMEAARNMLNEGFSVELIEKITELSKEEILKSGEETKTKGRN